MFFLKKERLDDGTRNIIFCGVKIFSYKRIKNKQFSQKKYLNYKKYNDLAHDIKKNLYKIPSNIDLVMGIPRSGMIPAYMIGLFINKKVCSVQEFIAGVLGNKGFIRKVAEKQIKTILVVDDTINTGDSINKIKELLEPYKDKYNFFFMAVYSASKKLPGNIDFYFEYLSQPRIFQWNYMYHSVIKTACYDMDGVLCIDPTEEENDDGEKYINFIKNAKPLYIPNYEIGYVVTSRLEKYRKETEEWLEKHGIRYKKLYMLNATAEERREQKLHAIFKAKIYKELKDASLFIESNSNQAKQIAEISKKRCICCETDEMYGEHYENN